jgi:OTU domain-containing protein 3
VLRELHLFQLKMKTLGCSVKGDFYSGIKGDGNCVFRAVSDQLYGVEDQHLALRAQTVETMVRAREEFEAFVVGESFDQYVARMAKEGVWADHLELQALSVVLRVNITVHHLQGAPAVIHNFPDESQTLHLSFHLGVTAT